MSFFMTFENDRAIFRRCDKPMKNTDGRKMRKLRKIVKRSRRMNRK